MELMAIKIKDIPILERPREKAIRYGIDSLSNIELLAIVIGSGIRGFSAIDIATQLFVEYGSFFGMMESNTNEFIDIEGINKVCSLKLKATFEIVRRSAYNYRETKLEKIECLKRKYVALLSGYKHEVLVIVTLNKMNNILCEKKLYKGTKTTMTIVLDDLIDFVNQQRGSKFILFHNHPSGDCTPSIQDLNITYRLKEIVKKIGKELYDHIIISNSNYFSMKSNNLI